MATLLPASLHPKERLWVPREALISWAAFRPMAFLRSNQRSRSGYAWTTSSISLGPYVNCDFMACTFFLHWMLSRSSSKSSSFPDESLRGTVSEEMTTHWIVTLLTSWLQNENCKTPRNTSVCLSFPCHLPKYLFSHYLLCRSWLTPWRPNLKH